MISNDCNRRQVQHSYQHQTAPPARSLAAKPMRLGAVLFGLSVFLLASPAHARPEASSALCEAYPDAAICMGRVAECSTCHISTWPPSWNEFGLQVLDVVDSGNFVASLPDAIAAIGNQDADQDGVSNLDELLVGTAPGDPEDVWPYCAAPAANIDELPVPEAYDLPYAYQRVMLLYCGRSPTYDEMAAFASDYPERAQQYEAVHATLSDCLDSEYWRDDALPRLADARIRPVSSVGAEASTGIIIGDFRWDYRLFTYVMTGDRDMRDLLLADYHVDVAEDGTLQPIDGLVPPLDLPGFAITGQPLEPQYRAGMITSLWFLTINTMFSPLPRTTAAQAYRAYLGADIAQQQGLWPVANEPADVDGTGVGEKECAICHSTLDPLSYAFAYYEGITGPRTSGTYQPDRPSEVIAEWTDNQGILFGQPVTSVREWAERAAESDAFKRNMALMLFRHAFEREPHPAEPLAPIWQALPEDNWSANRLLHRIIDIPAFGGVQ